MVLKQELTQTCNCGVPMKFPEGEVKTKCVCGANWECGPEGFWSISSFAPILARPVMCEGRTRAEDTMRSRAEQSVRTRAEKYKNYPKSRKKRGR